jgi:hypothetical protein
MENEKFITVLTATYGYEIAVIRGRLESEGIACFVKDELTVQVNPFYSNAIGGVKLQVRESDLNQALEILKETGYIQAGEAQPSGEPSRMNDSCGERQKTNDEKEILCPVCGSEEVAPFRKAGWLSLITLPLFTYPAPFLQKRYYCFNCRQKFKLKKMV